MITPSSRAGLVHAIVLLLASAACTPEAGTAEAAGANWGPLATSSGDASATSAAPTSGEAALPDGFPADFPLPEDLVVTEGKFTAGDAMTQANFLVRGTSPATVNDLWNFFNERLPDAGYEIARFQPLDAGANHALVYFHGDRFRDASVQLARADGATNVLINLPLRD